MNVSSSRHPKADSPSLIADGISNNYILGCCSFDQNNCHNGLPSLLYAYNLTVPDALGFLLVYMGLR